MPKGPTWSLILYCFNWCVFWFVHILLSPKKRTNQGPGVVIFLQHSVTTAHAHARTPCYRFLPAAAHGNVFCTRGFFLHQFMRIFCTNPPPPEVELRIVTQFNSCCNLKTTGKVQLLITYYIVLFPCNKNISFLHIAWAWAEIILKSHGIFFSFFKFSK